MSKNYDLADLFSYVVAPRVAGGAMTQPLSRELPCGRCGHDHFWLPCDRPDCDCPPLEVRR